MDLSSEKHVVVGAFFEPAGDGNIHVRLEVTTAMSGDAKTLSDLPAIMNLLRLSGDQVGQVLDEVNGGHGVKTVSVTTMSDLEAAGFRPAN